MRQIVTSHGSVLPSLKSLVSLRVKSARSAYARIRRILRTQSQLRKKHKTRAEDEKTKTDIHTQERLQADAHWLTAGNVGVWQTNTHCDGCASHAGLWQRDGVGRYICQLVQNGNKERRLHGESVRIDIQITGIWGSIFNADDEQ